MEYSDAAVFDCFYSFFGISVSCCRSFLANAMRSGLVSCTTYTSRTWGTASMISFLITSSVVIMAKGHPEHFPKSFARTIPSSKETREISPPCSASTGRIFSCMTCSILSFNVPSSYSILSVIIKDMEQKCYW